MKKNRKGFTLVELIAVSAIMVMLMGAILNFIQPMNKFYQKTQALADTNDIGSTMMNYVDDELRYATDVMILQDYEGVPALVGGSLVNDSGNVVFPGKFTNAIIIDNESVRGSLFEGYAENNTVAHRKKSTGCIMKAGIDDAGIRTQKLSALVSEDIFSDYKCEFDAKLSESEDESTCVTISMQLWRPRYSNGSYVFDKYGYNQVRDLELVNINLANAGERNMKAEFHSTRDGSLDYSQFPKAASGGAGNSADMYTGAHKYTYILYSKVIPTTDKIKVTLYKAEGTTDVLDGPRQINSGAGLSDSFIENWWNIAETAVNRDYYTNGGLTKHCVRLVAIETAARQDIHMFTSGGLLGDTPFYCITSDTEFTNPTQKFHFYDRYDPVNNAETLDALGRPGYDNEVGFWPDDEASNTGKVDWTGLGNGDAIGEYEFVGWNTNPGETGVPSGDSATDVANGWFVSGEEYTGEQIFYSIYRHVDMVALWFIAGDDGLPGEGSPYTGAGILRFRADSNGLTVLGDVSVGVVTQQANDRATDGGKVFKYWEVEDPANPGDYINLSTLSDFSGFPLADTATIAIKSHIEDPPPAPVSGANLEVVSCPADKPSNWGLPVSMFTAKVKNTGTDASISGEKAVEIEFNDDVEEIKGTYYEWGSNAADVRIAGRFIYMNIGVVQPGSTSEQNFQVSCANHDNWDFKPINMKIVDPE